MQVGDVADGIRAHGKGRRRQQHRDLSPKESTLLHAKRALNLRIYGRARPAGTALSTAVPGSLLTRKRTEVQLLPRPPHPSDVHFPNSCMPHLLPGYPITPFGSCTAVRERITDHFLMRHGPDPL